ncbi:MAG: T9SS type A sorting domain-containing protein [Phycisphaerae bacterium]|nr:T9SS type A sorting domain-containing protein [Saprospiraceae bacterium]
MKKLVLFILLWTIACQLFSQNWGQVGAINNTPSGMLNDTVSGLLYLAGNFRFNGVDTVDGFCAYDGSSFTSFGRRFDCVSYGCDPAFMVARYNGQLFLSGPGLTIIDGVDVKGIGQWNGAEWSAGMLGLYKHENDSNPYLDNYCIRDGVFYGVGLFRTAEGDTCNSVAYWNGQKWTGLDFLPYSDNSLPRVTSVIFYQNQLYVGGNFSWAQSGGADIARLDSTGWHMVGGGLKGGLSFVSDMQVYEGELYICGYFRKADGNLGNKIMRWDGQQWKEVGAGFCSPNVIPRKMMVYDGKLYVVGIFDCVDNDLLVSNIATWDGERWCSFGNSYFNNTILYIAEYKGEIYVGGGFTEVDGQPCRFFAKWVGDHSTDTCSEPISAAPEPKGEGFSLWPNPVRDILQLIAPSPVESVSVFDAVGRTVIRSEERGVARTSVVVKHLPAGVYFVLVRAGGKVWSGKFVKE